MIDKRIANNIAIGSLWLAAGSTVVVLGALILYVLVNGIGQITPEFIFTAPQGVHAEGGIGPTVVATLYVTALAMIIVTPIAILAAVYLAEYARQGRVVRGR